MSRFIFEQESLVSQTSLHNPVYLSKLVTREDTGCVSKPSVLPIETCTVSIVKHLLYTIQNHHTWCNEWLNEWTNVDWSVVMTDVIFILKADTREPLDWIHAIGFAYEPNVSSCEPRPVHSLYFTCVQPVVEPNCEIKDRKKKATSLRNSSANQSYLFYKGVSV